MGFDFNELKDKALDAAKDVDLNALKDKADDVLGDKAKMLDNVDLNDVTKKVTDLLDK